MNLSFESAVKILAQTGELTVVGYRWREVFLKHVTQTDAAWVGWNSKSTGKPILANETTYDRCVEAQLRAANNRIEIFLTVSDGDTLNGFPVKERCVFSGYFTELVPELEPVLERAFNRLIDAEVERREQARIDRLRLEVEYQFKRDFLVD